MQHTNTNSGAIPLRAFLRLKQVQAVTGLSRSNIYALMSKGLFPQSIKLSERSVAWDSEAVANWQAERMNQSKGVA